MLGCWSGRGWQFCLPLWWRDGGSSFGLGGRLGPCLRVARAVDGWRPFRVVLDRVCRGSAGGFLLLRGFAVAVSVGPRVCFV